MTEKEIIALVKHDREKTLRELDFIRSKEVTFNYALTHMFSPLPGEKKRQYGTGWRALRKWLDENPKAWRMRGRNIMILRKELENNF